MNTMYQKAEHHD